MIEREVFTDKDNLYSLLEGKDGDYYMVVLCGNIGLYEIKFKLNSEELKKYNMRGKKALDELAFKVAKNNEQYLKRAVD